MHFEFVIGFLTMQCVGGLRMFSQRPAEQKMYRMNVTQGPYGSFSSKQVMVPLPQLETIKLKSGKTEDDELILWQHQFFHNSGGAAHCGVVVAAFGDAHSKYLTGALTTIHRISQLKSTKGWCKAAPELEQVPVTLNTNLPPTEIQTLLSEIHGIVGTLPVDSFDDVDVTPPKQSHWDRLGAWKYQWFHCQVFQHAPHELMIYLDADAFICPGADLQSMFSDAEEHKWDLAFENSTFRGGYGMSQGNKRDPHPPTVHSEEDFESWEQLREANDGAVLFRKDKAQKFADDFCMYLHEDLTKENILGDQLAFRSALWNNMADLNIQIFAEDPRLKKATLATNRICRYQSRCSNGCTIYHSNQNLR